MGIAAVGTAVADDGEPQDIWLERIDGSPGGVVFHTERSSDRNRVGSAFELMAVSWNCSGKVMASSHRDVRDSGLHQRLSWLERTSDMRLLRGHSSYSMAGLRCGPDGVADAPKCGLQPAQEARG